MRILIFSDIHGNAVAFDAMLADLRDTSVDQMVCLGDVAQGGPQPAECLDRLQALGCPVVLGNSDLFLFDLDAVDESAEPITERQRTVREWSLSRLDTHHLEFMRTFQPTVEVQLEEHGSLLCFHGSPNSFDDVILPETSNDDFERMVAGRWAPLMAGGHVHIQWLRRHGDSQFFNPGSVGMAYDRDRPENSLRFDPWAEYAVVTVDGGSVGIEFRRVAYDAGDVTRSLRESEIPYLEDQIERWQRGLIR